DIAGKSQGKPVWELLAPRFAANRTARTRNVPATLVVPTKWSVSGVEPEKAAEIARWATSTGFTKMKVKVGIDPQQDVARVRAVRQAVGLDVKLGVDANGGWRTSQVAIDT